MIRIPGLRVSIFTPPTDVILVHRLRDGGAIGKHKSVDDYVHESADLKLSHPFGRVMAMRLIAEDVLTRLNIPFPKNSR